MPVFIIPWLIAGIATLIAGAVIADDVDQRSKRAEEQKRFQDELAKLETKIATLVQTHAMFSEVLDERNQQVRAMAEEISRQRAELALLKQRVAA